MTTRQSWQLRAVPKSKWQYRDLEKVSLWEEPKDLIWGICFSCGRVAVFSGGCSWRCSTCWVDMPWQQALPDQPWTRAPTSGEAIAYMRSKLKKPRKRK